MLHSFRSIRLAGLTVAALMILSLAGSRDASAASAAKIDAEVDAALKALYSTTPAAIEIAKVSKAILVFPEVVKGGFIVAAEYGTGAMRQGGKTIGYYNTAGASFGFQAGVQGFGYAVFLVTDSAIEYLEKSHGLEIGAGPSLTIVDEGIARNFSTTTLQNDMYAFFFDQKGLMGGLSLQGTKITKITPDP